MSGSGNWIRGTEVSFFGRTGRRRLVAAPGERLRGNRQAVSPSKFAQVHADKLEVRLVEGEATQHSKPAFGRERTQAPGDAATGASLHGVQCLDCS